jgi:hypothetical protein
VKTNSQGDTLWTRTYGGSSTDWAYSVQQTADGGYILAGFTYSFGAGTSTYPNMYLVKTNNLGDTLWTRTYGGSNYDYATSVQQTADGGYIVAGYTESFGAGYADFYLVKTGPDGLEAPSQLVILIQDENAVLNWPPTGAPSYNIYGATEPFISGILLATTSDTTWTDTNTSGRPSRYFYYVTAVAP